MDALCGELIELARADGARVIALSEYGITPVRGGVHLNRVLRETSAYYLLGVEPSDIDRDGRAHRLNVKVNQRGATVRSRQWVVLPRVKRSP